MQRRQGVVVRSSGSSSSGGFFLLLLLLLEPPLLGLFLGSLGLLGRLRRPREIGLVPGRQQSFSSRDVLLSQEDVTGGMFGFLEKVEREEDEFLLCPSPSRSKKKEKKEKILSCFSSSTHALLYRRSKKRVQNVERYTKAKANQCSGDPCGKFVRVNLEKEVNPGRASAAALAAFAVAASWKASVELEAALAAAAAAAAAAEPSTPCLTPWPRMLTGRRTKRATRARGKKICFLVFSFF